jgi:hypothetical protein
MKLAPTELGIDKKKEKTPWEESPIGIAYNNIPEDLRTPVQRAQDNVDAEVGRIFPNYSKDIPIDENIRSKAEQSNLDSLSLPDNTAVPLQNQTMAQNIDAQMNNIRRSDAAITPEQAAEQQRQQVQAADELARSTVQSPEDMSVANQDSIQSAVQGPAPTPKDQAAVKEDMLTRIKNMMNGMGNNNQAPKSASDQFLDALTYFAPTIGAGLIGNAIGGAEAGSAAAQSASKLNNDYLTYQEKVRKDSGLTQKDKLRSAVSLINADLGYKSLDNKIANAADLAKHRANLDATAAKNTQLREVQGNARIKNSQDALALQTKKYGDLTPTQYKDFGDLTAQHAEGSSLLKELKTPEIANLIGTIQGPLNKAKAAFNKQPEKFVKLNSMITNLNVNKIHSMFGSRVTKIEQDALDGVLPKVGDDLPNILRKMKQYQAQLKLTAINHAKVLPESKRAEADRIITLMDEGEDKPKQIKQNGHIYNLNEQTGAYE